ncbi:MAG: GGDEF domain-containing phosphodiesterase [Pseudomonadota bacterium]
MNQLSTANVFIITPDQDDLERIQSLMISSGLQANCHWVADAESLPEERLPEPLPSALLVLEADQLGDTLGWRDEHVPTASALLVADLVDESLIESALSQGANDAISLSAQARAVNVIAREVRLATAAAELAEAQTQVAGFRDQVERLTSESTRAFLWAQEGVVADANLACVTLLGLEDVADLVAMPVMDVFAADSRVALKGALVACQKGMWRDDSLRCRVLGNDEDSDGPKGQPVDAMLEADLFDGDDAVRIELTPARRDAAEAEANDAASEASAPASADAKGAGAARAGGDPFLPFHQRRNFLQKVTDGLERNHAGGLRVLYHVRIDKMNALVERWGPLGFEEILHGLADTIADSVHPGDIWGQLAGGNFCVLADRGATRDIEAWGEALLKKISNLTFLLSGEDVKVRACVGAAVKGRSDDLSSLASKAARASRKAQETGEDDVILHDANGVSLEQTADDKAVVKRINHAMRNDGFRLAYQPIADLEERGTEMFDVLIRMMDAGDGEVLPNQFLPAAERNGMMRAIDRWVMARAIGAANDQELTKLFVRVSRDSLPDRSLADWLSQQLSNANIKPDRLVLQVTETHATDNLGAASDMAKDARRIGCGFCLEHFGLGSEPRLLLESIPIDFIKIDGSLMQGFPTSSDLQDHVRSLVKEATDRDIVAIAERVEDANTMAALWSIGVEFIQGYYVQGHYVQAPEAVVMDGTGTNGP